MWKGLIENWYVILAFGVVVAIWAKYIYAWAEKPTKEQIANIKEWLLYAVAEAEKQLGGGTGQLKLRFVYDWAVKRFKWISFISFETFSE